MTLPPFPTDDATLDMLEAALDPWNHGNPDATSSSVWPLLDMMSRLGGSDPRAVEEVLDDGSDGGAQALKMRDPAYHDNDVIRALVGEVRRLRQQREVEHLWSLVQERLRYADSWTLTINPWGLYGCVEATLRHRDGTFHTNHGATLTKRLSWALGILPPLPAGHRDAKPGEAAKS